MDAVEVVYLLRRLGLSLEVNEGRLDVSPAEQLDDDAVWLIRSHRDAIIAELENDSPAWAWLVRFDDGTGKEIYRHAPATRAEIRTAYASAISIERLPECDWPHHTDRLNNDCI